MILTYSCQSEEVESDVLPQKNKELRNEEPEEIHSLTDSSFNGLNLVDLSKYDERIIIDLRYASDNNFMNRVLYDTINQLYLQREVVSKLIRVQDLLDSLHSGYRLKVFDGVRPVQVQREMWNSLDTIPTSRRGKFVSNPSHGSVHNFGAAVDLTIVNEKGVELDMGAGYDDFRKIAFPSLERHYLINGELTQAQVKNRQLLRDVMRSEGFRNIPSEWWHFNAYSRTQSARLFPMLITEGGEHKYVDIIQKDSSTIMVDRM